AGEMDDKEIEITLADTASPMQGLDIPGGGNVGMINLSEMLGKLGGGRTKTVKLPVRDAVGPLVTEESDRLLDQDSLTREALLLAENEGIVFLDEIDKVAARQGASVGMLDLSDMMKAFGGGRTKPRKIMVRDAWAPLIAEESDKLVDQEALTQEALELAENQGIVFLDEIDKVASSRERQGADVSREGVQRDLLPLIEGTTVATKYGPMKTDHILFIASGAFHVAKPSDLLPELQGRLPIRVELKALTEEDFVRILSDTRASLTEQYRALLATEGVEIVFAEDGIRALARIAAEVNSQVENIGARRLQTVLEKLLEDVSFEAEQRRGDKVVVDAAYVEKQLAAIARDTDLSKYVL
ncbi:MAG TPA: AAA family ATPase, partial [Allosphingosinicella sp.]|nr:AAA family ATPase [Allosphingosinicella sp.]